MPAGSDVVNVLPEKQFADDGYMILKFFLHISKKEQKLRLQNLAADKASVSLQGSGQSTLFVRDAANLTLRGSGDIHIHGNARQRETQKSGSGDITWH